MSVVFLALPPPDDAPLSSDAAKAFGIDPKAIAARITKEHEAKASAAAAKGKKPAKAATKKKGAAK